MIERLRGLQIYLKEKQEAKGEEEGEDVEDVRIRSTSKRLPTVVSTSQKAREIKEEETAKALGAEKILS